MTDLKVLDEMFCRFLLCSLSKYMMDLELIDENVFVDFCSNLYQNNYRFRIVT